jgi:putative OPT family oligopeptide transporter
MRPAELTVKAVGLGLFLAFVFGSANAYLGMKAGQTVSATIPAAVIAMAVFRLPRFKGTVLEQNIARTAASVGEALVAGAIFTLPSFMMVELNGHKLWSDLRPHYWEATITLLVGGLIGVFFIILLRRPLCVDAGLPWPESVASVEIVRAGQEAGDAPKYVFGAMGFGGLIQFLTSSKGIPIFREYLDGFIAFPRSVVRHFDLDKAPLAQVTHHGGIPWSTPSLSPALMGIGYIIGPELACINVAGGIIAWWLLIPLLLFFDPDLITRLGGPEKVSMDVAANSVWFNIVRPVAVGMMLVAAANTMFSMRDSIVQSIKGAFHRAKTTAPDDPTEQDMPAKWVFGCTAALMIPITAIFYYYTSSWSAALVTACVMAITGFLLSAVGGYLTGLVGASNQPTSGLTISALVISALVLLVMGVKGSAGVAAVLGVAAVVCVAVSVSGSLVQDLKAGHLLGGTPWKMQIVEIIAVVMLSFFLLWPIIALHEANLATGGIGGRELPAPQAGLMAQLAKGIVGGEMAWGLLGSGAAFALALILSGARAPMLIAVGMYLPFETTSSIFLGGLIRWIADRYGADQEKGTLLASGLIAGEAIVGILLATTTLTGIPSFAKLLTGSSQPPLSPALTGWLSLVAFASLGWLLIRVPGRRA